MDDIGLGVPQHGLQVGERRDIGAKAPLQLVRRDHRVDDRYQGNVLARAHGCGMLDGHLSAPEQGDPKSLYHVSQVSYRFGE
jgi:hypothetical protein